MLVLVSVIVTVTPGRARPAGSTMLPRRPPLTACADAPGAYRRRRSTAADAVNQRVVIIFLRNVTTGRDAVFTRLRRDESSAFFRLPPSSRSAVSHLWDAPALGARPRPDHAGQHCRNGPAP